MNKPTSSARTASAPTPTHDEIAQRAREIWNSRGQPAGQDLEIWLEAERQLQASAPAPAASAASDDSPAVEPTGHGVVKSRRGSKSLSNRVGDAMKDRGGIGQGGNARIDPTT